MGLEPTTFGTTIRRSNQLSYIHHIRHFLSNAGAKIIPFLKPCKNIVKKNCELRQFNNLASACNCSAIFPTLSRR